MTDLVVGALGFAELLLRKQMVRESPVNPLVVLVVDETIVEGPNKARACRSPHFQTNFLHFECPLLQHLSTSGEKLDTRSLVI